VQQAPDQIYFRTLIAFRGLVFSHKDLFAVLDITSKLVWHVALNLILAITSASILSRAERKALRL